jgi:hypothetical protein
MFEARPVLEWEMRDRQKERWVNWVMPILDPLPTYIIRWFEKMHNIMHRQQESP